MSQAQLDEFIRKRAGDSKISKPAKEDVFKQGIVFLEIITVKLVSKPRMTNSSKWKSKIDKRLKEYWGWVDEIKWNYKKINGRMYNDPVRLGFTFCLNVETRRDLDNVIKGIKDSLSGLAWKDDNIKYIRGYDYVNVVNIKKGDMEKLILRISPVIG